MTGRQTERELTGFPSIDKPWLQYYSEEDLKIEIPDCSMYENMHRHAGKYGKLVAIEYLGKKISYDELFVRIEKCAKSLKAFGVNQGEIVSVCLPNIPEVIYLLYAINRIGAVANMLDIRCGAPTLEAAVKEANSRILICLDAVSDKFVNVKENTNVKTVVAVSPIDSFNCFLKNLVKLKDNSLHQAIPNGFITWKQFLSKANYTHKYIDSIGCGEADAIIAYTGGTTGEPKGVIGTNRNVNAVIEMEFKVGFNQTVQDRMLVIAPPWTYYGICNSIDAPLCMGLRCILLPKLSPDELGEVLLKYHPNHVVTVPSALAVLLSERYKDAEFSFLKSLVVGADKLDESFEVEIDAYLQSHGSTIRVSKGYGMTEVMAAAAYSRMNANDIGSVGVPYPLNIISAFIETESGYKECKTGERGEIAIYGPTVMKSYFGDYRDHNSEILRTHEDGSVWAHTGDIGYVGEDGRIYMVGRLKRMFTKGGYKIFPATVEKCIMKSPAVEQAAVVSIDDTIRGKIEKAFVVKKNSATIDNDVLKAELSKLTAAELYEYEVPDIYEFVDSLPLTGMGKIDYKALEES